MAVKRHCKPTVFGTPFELRTIRDTIMWNRCNSNTLTSNRLSGRGAFKIRDACHVSMKGFMHRSCKPVSMPFPCDLFFVGCTIVLAIIEALTVEP